MPKQKAFGRRAVIELLDSELDVSEIFHQAGAQGREFTDLLHKAAARKIRLVPVSKTEIERMAPDDRHQGVIALYKVPERMSLEELINESEAGHARPLIVLDGIEDPGNLGAIIRSAEVFGVSGVVFRHRRSAGFSPIMVKASAGAALRLPLVEVSNIDNTIRVLKKRNYWVYGLHPEGKENLWNVKLDGKVVFVMGNEGSGLSRLVKERCDVLVKIPQLGKVASLNVSVSTGIILAEWMRQNHREINDK